MTMDESRFLGSAVAMAAGLYCKFERDVIVQQLDALRRRQELLRRAARRALGDPAAIEFSGLAGVRRVLQGLDDGRKIVLAGALLGLTTAPGLALRSMGLKIATVFGSLDEAHRVHLEAAGIRLIDLRVQNKFALFHLLRNLQAEGHLLVLRCDVPGRSSRRYRFLGYDVMCSNLIETYARLNGCAVVPIETSPISEREMTVTCGEPLDGPAETTQTLLSWLESSICRDPVNYAWSGTSIIFSDTRAVRNGFACLPQIIAWRDRRGLSEAADGLSAANSGFHA